MVIIMNTQRLQKQISLYKKRNKIKSKYLNQINIKKIIKHFFRNLDGFNFSQKVSLYFPPFNL